MKILIVHSGLSGVDYHRLIVPFQAMGKEYPYIQFFQINHLEEHEGKPAPSVKDIIEWGIEVCIFSRNISYKFDPAPIFAKLKAAKVKIVMDMDDYWYLPKNHVMSSIYKKANLSKCIEDQIRMCDAVICTHRVLANEIAKFRLAKTIYIAPNAIDPTQPQFNLEGLEYDYEHLYWQGSPTHLHDLELMVGAFDGLIDYKLTLGGYIEEEPIWKKYLELFAKNNIDFEPAVFVGQYARNYMNKGICLIPLKDNKFNRMKSELKAIEAGWFQKPVIASYTHPYTRMITNDVDGLFIHKPHEWKPKIKGLLSNHQWQDDLRMKLHETVHKRYLIERANQQRLNLLYDFKR